MGDRQKAITKTPDIHQPLASIHGICACTCMCAPANMCTATHTDIHQKEAKTEVRKAVRKSRLPASERELDARLTPCPGLQLLALARRSLSGSLLLPGSHWAGPLRSLLSTLPRSSWPSLAHWSRCEAQGPALAPRCFALSPNRMSSPLLTPGPAPHSQRVAENWSS